MVGQICLFQELQPFAKATFDLGHRILSSIVTMLVSFAQCGNFMLFLSLRLREINFEGPRSAKSNTFRRFELRFL